MTLRAAEGALMYLYVFSIKHDFSYKSNDCYINWPIDLILVFLYTVKNEVIDVNILSLFVHEELGK